MTTHADLVGRYKRLRSVSAELNKVLLDLTPKEAFERAGRKLGLWHKGTLVFGGESEMSVLMDYLIYDCYEGGANAVDRYVAADPPAPGSDAETVLQAKQRAFFAVLQIEEILPGVGARVHDLLSGGRFLLADISLSTTPAEGLFLATRLVPFDDFVMTSGASLPLEAEAFARVADDVLDRYVGDTPGAFAALSKEGKAAVSAKIFRVAIEANAGDAMEFADVEEAGAYVSTAPIRNTSPRTGRNAPCPCGSGRKYKKCCGRPEAASLQPGSAPPSADEA